MQKDPCLEEPAEGTRSFSRGEPNAERKIARRVKRYLFMFLVAELPRRSSELSLDVEASEWN